MNGSDKESDYDFSQEGWSKPSDESSQGSNMKSSSLNENVHFKILVPSIAAGAIIGKGGEAIGQIQKETGAKVKMSKANDFYPGTTERVCLILGTVEAITKMHNYIIDKIFEKADTSSKNNQSDNRMLADRHKQVKILVPNSTAGMIIGKGGAFIKEIKDNSGAFIQISQKSREVNLPERCIVIAGEPEQNRKATSAILAKIAEDPQSSSCPNISYADAQGPVASAYPTGSPYANSSPPHSVPSHQIGSSVLYSPVGVQLPGLPPTVGALQTHMSPVPSAGPQQILGPHATFVTGQQTSQHIFGGSSNQSGSSTTGTSFRTSSNLNMDSLRAALHCAGYPDSASQEIAAAMQVLDKYGFINMSVLSGSASSGSTLAASVASQSVSNSAFGMPGSSGHYQTFSGPPSGHGTLTAAYGASPPSFGNATLLSPGSSYNFGQPSIFQGYTTGPTSGSTGAISLPGHSSINTEDFFLMSSPPDFAATFSLYSPPLPQHHPSGFSFYQAQPPTATSTAFPSAEFLSQTQPSYNYVPVALSPQQLSTASGMIERTVELPDIMPLNTIEDIGILCEVEIKLEQKYPDESPGQSTSRHYILRGIEWNVSRALMMINETVQKFQRSNTTISSSSYSSMPVTQTTSGVDSGPPGVSATQTQ